MGIRDGRCGRYREIRRRNNPSTGRFMRDAWRSIRDTGRSELGTYNREIPDGSRGDPIEDAVIWGSYREVRGNSGYD
jgi:hypothetical protein